MKRQPRYHDGRYAKSWSRVIKEFFKDLFSKKTYYQTFIVTLTFTFTYVSMFILFSMIREVPVKHVEAKEYTGITYTTNEKLNALIGTEMEDAIPFIEKSAKYYDLPVSIYVGVAFAESSFNNFKDDCYNPWGIGNGGPVCYEDWKQGVDEFGRLIKYYYYAEGKYTPDQLLRKYVGWENPYWVNNVKTYYDPKIVIQFD